MLLAGHFSTRVVAVLQSLRVCDAQATNSGASLDSADTAPFTGILSQSTLSRCLTRSRFGRGRQVTDADGIRSFASFFNLPALKSHRRDKIVSCCYLM